VEAVNVVLRRVGLSLEHAGKPVYARTPNGRVRRYQHRLSHDAACLAAELVQMRMPSAAEGDGALATSIRALVAQHGRYGHLGRGAATGGLSLFDLAPFAFMDIQE